MQNTRRKEDRGYEGIRMVTGRGLGRGGRGGGGGAIFTKVVRVGSCTLSTLRSERVYDTEYHTMGT